MIVSTIPHVRTPSRSLLMFSTRGSSPLNLRSLFFLLHEQKCSSSNVSAYIKTSSIVVAESRRKRYGELRQSRDSENENPQRPWRLCNRSVTSRVLSVVELLMKHLFVPLSTDMVYTLTSKLLKTIPQVFLYIHFVTHPECISLIFFFIWIGCRRRQPRATSPCIRGWAAFQGSIFRTATKLRLRVSHAIPP